MDTGRTIGKDGEAVLIIVFITTGLEVYLDFAFLSALVVYPVMDALKFRLLPPPYGAL